MPVVDWTPVFDEEASYQQQTEEHDLKETLRVFTESYGLTALYGVIEQMMADRVMDLKAARQKSIAQHEYKADDAVTRAAMLDIQIAYHECAQRCVDDCDRLDEAADWRWQFIHTERQKLTLGRLLTEERTKHAGQ